MDAKKLIDVVGLAYQASMEPRRWDSMLVELAPVFGADNAMLFVMDPHYPEFSVSSIGGCDPEKFSEYMARFSEHEAEQLQKLLAKDAGILYRDDDSFEESRLLRFPNVQWMRSSMSWERRAAMRISNTSAWTDVLTLQYPLGRDSATEEEQMAAAIVVPHLRAALEMARPYHILRQRFSGVLSALNRWHIGVFVLDALGSVVLQNREGERLVLEGDAIAVGALNRLRIIDADSREQFERYLSACVRTASGSDLGRGGTVTVRRRSGRGALLVEVDPLVDPDGGELGLAGAVVFVFDTDKPPQLDVSGLTELYGLSRAESAICGYILEGMSQQEIADYRCVSTETVKSQVKSLLRKTDCSSREGLVRLVAKTTPPIDPRNK